MIVPNKTITFQQSLLSKLPALIVAITRGVSNPIVLYSAVSDEFDDITQFMLALDTLFILEKVELVNEGNLKC